MKKYGIILFLAILASCHSDKKDRTLQPSKAIVEGQVELSDNSSNAITLIYGNNILGTERKTEIVDANGKFRFRFNILHPQYTDIRYEDGVACFFVHPGDSLFITLNFNAFKNKQFPDYKISGNSSETSRNIQNYLQYMKKYIENFDSKLYADSSVEQYLEVIKQQIAEEDSALSEFCENNRPTADFVTWAENDMIYNLANYLITYRYFNQELKHDRYVALFDKKIFPVDRDEAFVSRLYALHLRHYALGKYYQADSVQRLLDNNQNKAAYKKCLNDLIAQEEPGLSRDVMCYKVISTINKEDNPETFTAILKDRKKYLKNGLLLSRLESRLSSANQRKKRPAKESIEKKSGSSISYIKYETGQKGEFTGDLLNHLAEKYKGKVIYVDIWATWCGPCRSEFRHTIDLHEAYKNEPVVFVSLCLASARKDWKKVIQEQHLPGERYYFNKTESKLLRNQLEFQGYPTYMLIDKDGNLVDRQAPRPSSDENIKNILDNLIGD